MATGDFIARLARVVLVENGGSNGLRIKATYEPEKAGDPEKLPWYFPLMPKVFQVVPKKEECVLVLLDEAGSTSCQGYYIGPIISQPQFQEKCDYDNAISLLKYGKTEPLPAIPKGEQSRGFFPETSDVAVIGRGTEDIILRNREDDKTSEIDIRAGIRSNIKGDDNEKNVGNVIFNKTDPAYIQLKYKKGLGRGDKKEGNSIINMVADRINIMSNKDYNVNNYIHDGNNLVKEESVNDVMDNLHQVPKGDNLVELLKLMKGAIMHHVHPWAGMEQCGDWAGYIKKLDGYDIDSILSEYVRIS